jgi:hypothetical protein
MMMLTRFDVLCLVHCPGQVQTRASVGGDVDAKDDEWTSGKRACRALKDDYIEIWNLSSHPNRHTAFLLAAF